MRILKRLSPDLPHGERYMFLYIIALIEMIFSLVLNSPSEIVSGLYRIMISPSTLISDYFVIGNPGAAFMNSGLLLILGLGISRRAKKELSGPMVAAYLTLAGFSFFGKNLYNSWAVPLGIYLYSKYEKDRFSNNIIFALFGTTLGPLTSLITFGLGLPLPLGIVFGNLAGIAAGIMIPPLAAQFIRFHQGFNLYNIGFTAGIIGMFMMGLLRGFGFDSPAINITASGYNIQMGIFIFTIANVMLFIGLSRCSWSLDGFKRILESSGRGTDLIAIGGFGAVLINMAIMSTIATCYVLLVGGQLNGPIMGGIFTIAGFSASGKHPRNTVPVLAGVFLATTLHISDTNSTGALLAALFGTTLAPISGHYGWFYGILAGLAHMSVVSNIGYVHGGVNLYNNGFSGGFIAAVMVPLIEALRGNKTGTVK
ncbi:DUF1576 domain-containing protein [Youngiibacter multivorans]|uniref:DUF1576 domain-containing protein n=1 Tax=Youngiibacter multivorans TaxID=937251 RepID=A0ABS4G0R0_9CLOT|nr:DUF1576 domain-containing protein [Youngiibacter multivorans]MBP1918143.1 hypothetical protein [Youngiibacter multivorans]